jgi:hypothetical protein
MEPPQRAPDQPRRPYTQRECDVARELGKPLYLFLASEVGFLRRARKNGRCSLPIGTPLSGARTSITPLPSGRIFAAGCANCACPPGAPGRRAANLPYASLGPLFKGRDAALAELKQRLQSGVRQAIHGLGGVGKTRLAIEYA